MYVLSRIINNIYWRKSGVDSATKKKMIWKHQERLPQMKDIVDLVNTCRYRRQTQFGVLLFLI